MNIEILEILVKTGFFVSLILFSLSGKFFYNLYCPFLTVGNVGALQKTVGIYGTLKFVGILGAFVSEKWEYPPMKLYKRS